MKRTYEEPRVETVKFASEDILLLSAEKTGKNDNSFGIWNLYPDMDPENP